MHRFPRPLRVAALVLGCAQGAAVALAQDAVPAPMPPAERAYRASRVYAAALTYFAHWADAPDAAAIDSAYRAYVEAALSSHDRAAFTRASMRFLATFRNGHTIFLDFALAREAGTLPFTARTVEASAGKASGPATARCPSAAVRRLSTTVHALSTTAHAWALESRARNDYW
jgi:hypothetical protein